MELTMIEKFERILEEYIDKANISARDLLCFIQAFQKLEEIKKEKEHKNK